MGEDVKRKVKRMLFEYEDLSHFLVYFELLGCGRRQQRFCLNARRFFRYFNEHFGVECSYMLIINAIAVLILPKYVHKHHVIGPGAFSSDHKSFFLPCNDGKTGCCDATGHFC